jgi:hypothetical protein
MTTAVEERTSHKGEICKLDSTGDTKLIWNTDSDDETAAAETMFNTLKGKGYIGYKVKKDGSKGEAISKFDETAEKIIMAPPVVGG